MEKEIKAGQPMGSSEGNNNFPASEVLINASGHRQELDRNFHLINIAGLGITSGNTWIAIGGSIVCIFRFPQSLMKTRADEFRLWQSIMAALPVLFMNCNYLFIVEKMDVDMDQDCRFGVLLVHCSLNR